jgi:hypothetical protein
MRKRLLEKCHELSCYQKGWKRKRQNRGLAQDEHHLRRSKHGIIKSRKIFLVIEVGNKELNAEDDARLASCLFLVGTLELKH